MRTLILLTLLMVPAAAGAAQEPVPGPAPAKPVVPRNIRFEVTITDAAVSTKPVSKTVVVTVVEGNTTGSVRSEAPIPGAEPSVPNGFTVVDKDGKTQPMQVRPTLPLNFDVRLPRVIEDRGATWVQANISVEYQPYVADAKTRPATVRAGSTSVFENGKKTILLQAADPISDRRTTIEVTATVLK
jgi:hypothetical protein